MLFLLNKPIYDMSRSELETATSSKELPEKKKVLEYLKSFEKCAYTTQPVIDGFTGEKLDCIDDARSDGVYRWYESEIYHFEKYNLKLNDDFIQHVLNRL